MPTATKNPLEVLSRIRRLPKLPPPTAADLIRLRALASDNIEPVPDADSPEVDLDDPRVFQVNPVLFINARNASWFARHGGSVALNRALNAYRASQRSRRTRHH